MVGLLDLLYFINLAQLIAVLFCFAFFCILVSQVGAVALCGRMGAELKRLQCE